MPCKSEKAVHSSALYEAVFEKLADAVIYFDKSGMITCANPAAGKLLGSRESWHGQHIRTYIPAFNGEINHSDHVVSSVENTTSSGYHETTLQHGHRTIPVELSITTVSTDGFDGYICLIRDISARKQIEAKVHQQAEEIRRNHEQLAHLDRISLTWVMSSSIAHELNQPLTSILLYTQTCKQLFRQQKITDQDFIKTLERVEKQANRAIDIINNWRHLINQKTLPAQEMDINKLVEKTLDLVQADIAARHIHLNFQPFATPLVVEVIETQIQQVMINLIRNAADALTVRPQHERLIRITIKPTQDHHCVKVTVQDNGEGIPQEQFHKIFEPFYTSKGSGLGMGLAISQSIIKDHGGVLEANEQCKDGTEFVVTLPISPV